MKNNHKSKIEIFSLGGLGENGRNLYVCNINHQLFIFDAGIKYPGEDLLGVDAVIPDIKYLIENKNKIVGLFLSNAHDEHIGAVPNILEELNIPVYGSRFTIALVEDAIKERGKNPKDYRLYQVRPTDRLTFSNVMVSFFRTSFSIPDSLGIALHTKDGVIVYTSNFTFDQSATRQYQTDYQALTSLAREGVLALLSESIGADKPTITSSDRLSYELEEQFKLAPGRIIVSVYSSDLKQIQRIIDIAHAQHKKIAIIGRKVQRLVDLAVKMGYLRFPQGMLVKLKYIDETTTNNFSNLVVIATGERHEPFDALIRMARKIDRLIHIEPTDKIIIAAPPVTGNEIKVARTIDLMYRTGADVHVIKKSLFPSTHASGQDLKLMMNLLQPKYIIPVIGEYRHLHNHAKVAESIGYSRDQIVIMENGYFATFINGEFENVEKRLTIDQVLVDGLSVGDINSVVLRDRQVLSQDGIVLAIVTVDYKTKTILAGPEIVSRGFIYVKENEDIIQTLTSYIKDAFNDGTKDLQSFDMTKIKSDLREKMGKYLYKETKRKPIVMLIVNEL